MDNFKEYKLSESENIQMITRGFILIFLLFYLFYRSIPLALVGGSFVFLLKKYYVRIKKEKRDDEILLQFKDFLVSLSFSIETGRQMEEAIKESYNYMIEVYGEKKYLIKSIEYMKREMEVNHVSDRTLLIELGKSTDIVDIINFVEVYIVALETGGDLKKIINNNIQIILDKLSILREIKTMSAQRYFELKVITVMPIIVILFFNIFNSDYITPLYEGVGGRIIMTLSLIGIIGAYYLGKKIMSIEI
ncbi:MAG: type II secretion system F family protein [Anaerovoracaceae bacterium]